MFPESAIAQNDRERSDKAGVDEKDRALCGTPRLPLGLRFLGRCRFLLRFFLSQYSRLRFGFFFSTYALGLCLGFYLYAGTISYSMRRKGRIKVYILLPEVVWYDRNTRVYIYQ